MSCCFSRPIDLSGMSLQQLQAREAQLGKDLYPARREDWKNGLLIAIAFFLIMFIGMALRFTQPVKGDPTDLTLIGMAISIVGGLGAIFSPGLVCRVKRIEKELEAIRAAIWTQSQQSRG